MNITITIQAPELVLAIEDLAQALQNLQSGGVLKAVPAISEGEAIPAPETEEKPTEAAQEPQTEKPVDIETVRAELAVLTKKGKREEVRALIQRFGAEKLPEVPPEKFRELLAEARKLG